MAAAAAGKSSSPLGSPSISTSSRPAPHPRASVSPPHEPGRAAPGGPHPNPSGDAPRLRSPPGKGKPVALADISNTGRPNATRSVSVAEVVKENAKLAQLLNEKTRIIELSRVEMQKLHLALQASRQQNQQLALANSQMLAELNLGKDRLKALQHELSCTAAVLKVKDSELERKNKAATQRRKEASSQEVMKAIPSKVAAVEAHRIDGSVASAAGQHSVDSQSAVPSTTGCDEPPKDIITKRISVNRGRNKRKSESSECIKDTNIMQDHYRPHLQPIISLDHEDPRKPVRRRSARLNTVSCEVTEVSCEKLPEDDVVPSAPSSFSVQKQHGSITGIEMEQSLQKESSAIMPEVAMASGFKKFEINEQAQKEANLKEVEEACSSVPGTESHQIGDEASNIKQSNLAETQSSLPFNIIEPSKALEGTGNKRGASKQKLKLCASGKDSAIEHINAKCDSSTSETLHHKEKRKSQRRKSARSDSVLSKDTNSTVESLHEDVIVPLPPSSSNALMETEGCSSMKSTEGQVTGRKSLRRAAEKVVSYKEISLKIKMRRP
ncbi:hypothetical protein EJB05_13521, partial [Eragrostis curvula]